MPSSNLRVAASVGVVLLLVLIASFAQAILMVVVYRSGIFEVHAGSAGNGFLALDLATRAVAMVCAAFLGTYFARDRALAVASISAVLVFAVAIVAGVVAEGLVSLYHYGSLVVLVAATFTGAGAWRQLKAGSRPTHA